MSFAPDADLLDDRQPLRTPPLVAWPGTRQGSRRH